MTRLPPPLRFLVGLCAGWTCARAGLLWLTAADHQPFPAPRPLVRAGPAAAVVGSSPLQAPRPAAAASFPGGPEMRWVVAAGFAPADAADVRATGLSRRPPTLIESRATPIPAKASIASTPPTVLASTSSPARMGGPADPVLAALAPALGLPGSRPWSVYAWAFVRRGGATALAPAGELGGSQAGVRGTYRIAGREAPVALSLRVSVPLEQPRGAEAAAGIDWKPLPRLPLHLLVERRQKLGTDGRSAFGATVYGGGEAKLGPLRLDAYAQAGIVGLKRRDVFADGAVRAAVPLGPLRLGAGAWAAAQPGVSRVDLGPHAALRLPPLHAALSADWRVRIAGSARPGSGPALTLAADF